MNQPTSLNPPLFPERWDWKLAHVLGHVLDSEINAVREVSRQQSQRIEKIRQRAEENSKKAEENSKKAEENSKKARRISKQAEESSLSPLLQLKRLGY